MWAQLIKNRVKPGQEETVKQLPQEMEERQRRGEWSQGGPTRVIVMQDQKDPSSHITLIVFESEAKAREYEGSAQQQEVQKRMKEVFQGPPEFTDLNVLYEMTR